MDLTIYRQFGLVSKAEMVHVPRHTFKEIFITIASGQLWIRIFVNGALQLNVLFPN